MDMAEEIIKAFNSLQSTAAGQEELNREFVMKILDLQARICRLEQMLSEKVTIQ